ncbi:MAG: amino acid ABC transporter substrate-binding protein [Victivallales bacterium]|nr:amino acid ABC transporter substrate-binding protein [Victivallales bacterium]
MKYIAFSCLVAILLLTIVSCNWEEKAEEDSWPKKRTVGVLLSGKPFAFLDEQGNLSGIEPELMRRIAKDEGFALTLKPVESVEEMHNGLIDGTLDGGIGRQVREELPIDSPFSYTDPYLSSYLTVLITADSDLERLADLSSRRIGVQQGTRADEVISAREDVFIRRYEHGSEAVQALLDGNLEAVVMGNRSAEEFLKRYEDKLDELEDTLAMVNYAMVVRNNEYSLAWDFNGQLLRLRGIGFVQELREKYDQDFLDEAK